MKRARASILLSVILCLCIIGIYACMVTEYNEKIIIIASADSDSSVSADAVEESSIEFVKKKSVIKAGTSYKFKAVKKGIEDNVTYSVNKPKYATVTAKGKLTAKRMGTVTLTARAGEYLTKVKIRIKPKGIVALDPGHSPKQKSGTEPNGPGSSVRKAKDNTGTCGVSTGVPEYKLTLILAEKMKKILTERGYKVVMTREDNNTAISCAERAKVANKAKADIFVRIHADGNTNHSISGASALYPTKANKYISRLSDKSKKLSLCVLDAMCGKSGAKKRGLFARDDLTGTNWAKMPVTLIEVGFMSNPSEDRKMKEDSYRNKLAEGMCDGIDDYFGY